jgi:hypothetical protein
LNPFTTWMFAPPNLLCRFDQELLLRDQFRQNIDIESVIFKTRPTELLRYQLISPLFHKPILLFSVFAAKAHAVFDVIVDDEIRFLICEAIMFSENRVDLVND